MAEVVRTHLQGETAKTPFAGCGSAENGMGPAGTGVDAGGVGVVMIDNPAVNALSSAVAGQLREVLARGNVAPAVDAAVIPRAGQAFVAGADIREFEEYTSGRKVRGEGLHPLSDQIASATNRPEEVSARIGSGPHLSYDYSKSRWSDVVRRSDWPGAVSHTGSRIQRRACFFGWKAAPLLERLVFEGRSFRIVMPFDDARHSQSTTRRIVGPCGEVGERGIDFFDTPET